jgi:hypothetical protein
MVGIANMRTADFGGRKTCAMHKHTRKGMHTYMHTCTYHDSWLAFRGPQVGEHWHFLHPRSVVSVTVVPKLMPSPIRRTGDAQEGHYEAHEVHVDCTQTESVLVRRCHGIDDTVRVRITGLCRSIFIGAYPARHMARVLTPDA